MVTRVQEEIAFHFEHFGSDGVALHDFVPICKNICGFPTFFSTPLFKRIILLHRRWAAIATTDLEIQNDHEHVIKLELPTDEIDDEELDRYVSIGRTIIAYINLLVCSCQGIPLKLFGSVKYYHMIATQGFTDC